MLRDSHEIPSCVVLPKNTMTASQNFLVWMGSTELLSSSTWACMRQPQESQSVPKSNRQTIFELWQAWCSHPFSGEPVSVPNHPVAEEPFPHIQPRPPLAQLPCHSFGSSHWSKTGREQCMNLLLSLLKMLQPAGEFCLGNSK